MRLIVGILAILFLVSGVAWVIGASAEPVVLKDGVEVKDAVWKKVNHTGVILSTEAEVDCIWSATKNEKYCSSVTQVNITSNDLLLLEPVVNLSFENYSFSDLQVYYSKTAEASKYEYDDVAANKKMNYSVKKYSGFTKIFPIGEKEFAVNVTYTALKYSSNKFNVTIGDWMIDPDQDQCGTIASSGYYKLNQSVATNATCFTITVDDVVFDCAFFNVTGNVSNTTSFGFALQNRDNVTIANCSISGFANPISFLTVTNSSVINTNVSNASSNAIRFATGTNNNTLINVSSTMTGAFNAWSLTSSNYNYAMNSIFNSQTTGAAIDLSQSRNNFFENVTANGTSGFGYSISTGSVNNSFVNSIAQSASNTALSSSSSASPNNTMVNVTVRSGGTRSLSLADSNTTFIGVLFHQTTISASLSAAATNNLFYDSHFNSSTSNALLIQGGRNNTFTNCNVTSNTGIAALIQSESVNNSFKRVIFSASGTDAVRLQNSHGQFFENVTANSSTGTAFSILGNTSNSTITNSTIFSSTGVGLFLNGFAINNTFSNNSVSSGSNFGVHIMAGYNNSFYNMTIQSASSTALYVSNQSRNNFFSQLFLNASRGLVVNQSLNTTFSDVVTNSTHQVNITESSNDTSFNGLLLQGNFNITVSSDSNLSARNVTFLNEFGSIHYTQFNGSSINTSRMNITQNRTFLNSSLALGMNTTATIVLNITATSISAIEPTIDENDDGLFSSCTSCVEDSYSGTTYMFNVTGFTSYSFGVPAAAGGGGLAVVGGNKVDNNQIIESSGQGGGCFLNVSSPTIKMNFLTGKASFAVLNIGTAKVLPIVSSNNFNYSVSYQQKVLLPWESAKVDVKHVQGENPTTVIVQAKGCNKQEVKVIPPKDKSMFILGILGGSCLIVFGIHVKKPKPKEKI